MYPGMYPGTYAGDGSPPRTMKCRDGVYRQAGGSGGLGDGGPVRLLVAANDNEHDRQMRADDWYWSADRAALMREAPVTGVPEMKTGRAA